MHALSFWKIFGKISKKGKIVGKKLQFYNTTSLRDISSTMQTVVIECRNVIIIILKLKIIISNLSDSQILQNGLD